MKTCPNLKMAGRPYCVSEGRSYLPSSYRLSGYCKSALHKDCTLYLEIMDRVRLFTYGG